MVDLRQDQYVVVGLGNEKYALRIYDIYEIIKMQKITEVPNSKSFLEGVINLRGKMVPVISLHRRFGINDVTITKTTRIVVISYQEEIIGMIVDCVQCVTTFTEIEPAPDTVYGLDGDFFEGVAHSEDGLVSILKIEKVLFE